MILVCLILILVFGLIAYNTYNYVVNRILGILTLFFVVMILVFSIYSAIHKNEYIPQDEYKIVRELDGVKISKQVKLQLYIEETGFWDLGGDRKYEFVEFVEEKK